MRCVSLGGREHANRPSVSRNRIRRHGHHVISYVPYPHLGTGVPRCKMHHLQMKTSSPCPLDLRVHLDVGIRPSVSQRGPNHPPPSVKVRRGFGCGAGEPPLSPAHTGYSRGKGLPRPSPGYSTHPVEGTFEGLRLSGSSVRTDCRDPADRERPMAFLMTTLYHGSLAPGAGNV